MKSLFFLFSLYFILHLNLSAQNCDTVQIGSRTNLGIYGGKPQDFCYTNSGRLFASVGVPYSLFTSDDTGSTWYPTFPFDSLEYECGVRGWGGGGNRIISNQKNWVATYTQEPLGGVSSAEISFQNGDTGTWHTAIDPYMLESFGYDTSTLTNICMSDFHLYVTFDKYIARIDTSSTDSADVFDVSTKLIGFGFNNFIASMIVSNKPTGYPYYLVIDSGIIANSSASAGKLYKYNGTFFSKIPLPSAMKAVVKVFNHPQSTTGDTIFITGNDTADIQITFRSFDGGSSWTNITPNQNGPKLLSDADYCPVWEPQMPLSKGLLLIDNSSDISKDLGNTWIESAGIPQSSGLKSPSSLAMHPKDTSIFSAGATPGTYLSKTGIKGPLVQQADSGLAAILVHKIDKTKNKTVLYIATESGLAYTTKYSDNNITAIDKWKSPYGIFPIDSTDLPGGVTAVVINPNDSSHVIAGASNCIFVSKSGPNGFKKINPNNYYLGMTFTQDIAFVTSDIIIAVTGTSVEANKGYGDIWRSSDGGYSWSNVSPSTFGTGTTVAVGYGKTDTVIYVGSGLMNVETGYLWISADLGLNWSIVNIGPSDYTNASNTGLTINDIAVDTRGKDTLYIAAGYAYQKAIVKSTDGGQTYTQINMAPSRYYTAVEIDTKNPDSVVYVANENDLYKYIPALDSSILISTGLPGEIMHDIAIGSVLVGTTVGFYTVLFENTDVDITTTVENYTTINETYLYPNPTSNYITINIKSLENNCNTSFEICDVIGKLQAVKVDRFNNNSFKIHTENLSNGVYLLKITNGKYSCNKKIIVAK